jgi:2-polyprenyl-6-methoxyphenol hydroxylase-like FAD-dependent oxidoreductase
MDQPRRHRVVIIGGGLGGLAATKALRRAPVEVTLVDRQTHHLFQPLLYHVATGILSEGNVSAPLRDVLRHQRNAQVVLAEAAAEAHAHELRKSAAAAGAQISASRNEMQESLANHMAQVRRWLRGKRLASPRHAARP